MKVIKHSANECDYFHCSKMMANLSVMRICTGNALQKVNMSKENVDNIAKLR